MGNTIVTFEDRPSN